MKLKPSIVPQSDECEYLSRFSRIGGGVIVLRGACLKVVFATFMLGLLAMPAWPQDSAPALRDSISGYESAAHQFSQGVPVDWSSRHVVFSKPKAGSDAEDKVQQDPRYWMQQIRRAQAADEFKALAAKPKPNRAPKSHKDWAFSMGNGTVAQNMFPAKFSFNAGSTTLTAANCTSDFAVYGLNVAGATGGQANLVALDNLYSGTAPTGLCGTAPTPLWAYNVTTQAGGTVTTSPALSLDRQRGCYSSKTSAAGPSFTSCDRTRRTAAPSRSPRLPPRPRPHSAVAPASRRAWSIFPWVEQRHIPSLIPRSFTFTAPIPPT